MEVTALPIFRDQLANRRQKLEAASTASGQHEELQRLLREVDAALGRIDAGTFGLCKTCGDAIEPERLLADPLTRFCLDHLTAEQQRALQQDLELASRIQRELLPKADVRFDGWDIAYHYQPAGPVSGDYCDLIPGTASDMYFLIGDVAGKGVAAAMLMAHLSATMRMLISLGLPLCDLIERASRVFCESTLPMHYATLVCGRASSSGDVEICNAGHPPPLLIRSGRHGSGGDIARLEANGFPIGIFCSERFSSHTLRLAPSEMLLFYTDGLLEARNAAGVEYGIERLSALAAATDPQPREIVDACLRDLAGFRSLSGLSDDLTILAVRRS